MTLQTVSRALRQAFILLVRLARWFKRETYDSVRSDKLRRHQTKRYYRVYPEELEQEIRELRAEFWLVLPWIVALAIGVFTAVMLMVTASLLGRALVL